ncbi:MAG: MIT C-terminal domain-containing protein [Nitrospiraceae bacterium]
MIRFEGNCSAGAVRQAKYRLKRHGEGFQVEAVIETPDGERLYPASRVHPELVVMVNPIKQEGGGGEGGQFYVNEFRQVIVPAGNPVEYYYAGDYPHDIILALDGQEFSGRPLDDQGNLLKPGDPWSGRPRPGIRYILKAGGADIEYEREISPGRGRVVRLSGAVGESSARGLSRKIAAIKGNAGGPFYVNEYRAMFGPVRKDEGMAYLFIGVLTDGDPWFPRWTPTPGSAEPVGSREQIALGALSGRRPAESGWPKAPVAPEPSARTVEIQDGECGYTYERLFGDYLRGAKVVTVEDPFIAKPYQVANFVRFSELCVRIGSIREITLLNGSAPDDAYARLVSLQKSLKGYNIDLQVKSDPSLHDRRIETDTGWSIHLGRGLDIYKRPEDFCAVGASDFELRPCFKTRIIYQKR